MDREKTGTDTGTRFSLQLNIAILLPMEMTVMKKFTERLNSRYEIENFASIQQE
jgi:hypothetical protein